MTPTSKESSSSDASSVRVAAHRLLEVAAFTTTFEPPIGASASSPGLLALLRADAAAPMTSSDAVRAAVRDLLREGGFKPTGRSKPASEYLIRAAAESALGSINLAVDACNAVSLHSGLPISVVDLAKARAPFALEVAAQGASYVFNASGQTIDVGGLLCLFDADGPCANAVKDAQRTKTDPATSATLSIVWGTTELPGRAREAAAWYRELLAAHGARTSDVRLVAGA